MAQRDLLNRSLDAGREVTRQTQDRFEALLRELAKAAEDQAQQAQQLVQDLVERSRTTTEQIVDVIDRELRSQVGALGLATRADIDRLEARIDELQLGPEGPRPRKKAAAKKATAKQAAKGVAARKKAGPDSATARAGRAR